MNKLLPGVNVVVVCPDLKLRDTLIKAIQATSGITPALKSDSQSAQRAHYAPAISKLIVNTAAPEMHQRLGKHHVVLAIETENRVEAAKRAQAIFVQEGFEATVHTQAEPEFPDGFIPFVEVRALEGILLMFWPTPKEVTPEVMATLPKREPWIEK